MGNFHNYNPLCVAFLYKSFKVIKFFLDEHMIDIITCLKYSPLASTTDSPNSQVQKQNSTDFISIRTPSVLSSNITSSIRNNYNALNALTALGGENN